MSDSEAIWTEAFRRAAMAKTEGTLDWTEEMGLDFAFFQRACEEMVVMTPGLVVPIEGIPQEIALSSLVATAVDVGYHLGKMSSE